jgi:hypothetical protein
MKEIARGRKQERETLPRRLSRGMVTPTAPFVISLVQIGGSNFQAARHEANTCHLIWI